jgi:hypothetical protein
MPVGVAPTALQARNDPANRGEPARFSQSTDPGATQRRASAESATVRSARRQHRPPVLRALALANFPIQKMNRREGLVLGRRSNVLLNREVTQERIHLRSTHLPRVAIAVKVDEPANPVNIGLFGTQAVMLDTATLAHLIEQPRTTGRCHGRIFSLGYHIFIATSPQDIRSFVNEHRIMRRNRRCDPSISTPNYI